MWEFSFVLTKNLLALTEKNGSLVCIPSCSQAVSVKSEACQILPIITFVYCSSFYYFRRFCHSEGGIKSLRLEVTCIDLHWFLFCWRITDLTFSAFAWTDLSDLDDPLDCAFVKKLWPRYDHTRTDRSVQWRRCGGHHKMRGSVLRKTMAQVGMHFFGKKNLELLFQGKWGPWKS